MNNDNWQALVAKIKSGCQNINEEVLPLLDLSGREIERGTLHVLEFDAPDGSRYQLKREYKPRVLTQQQHYSGRAGTAAMVDYEVSDTDFVDHVALYLEDDYGEWQSVPLERLVA